MPPYRDVTTRAPKVRSESIVEELILYGLLVVIGAIPVALAVAWRTAFDTDATLGLLMLCGGVAGIVVQTRRTGARDERGYSAGGAGSRRR